MKTTEGTGKIAIITFCIAIALFFYLIYASKALSYLSTDSKACINCHVMNTQYASWQHSSHASRAGCVDCHLPTHDFVEKYMAKAKDGWHHSVAFTLKTYEPRIQISEEGAKRVQANCISCHKTLTSLIRANQDQYHNFSNPSASARNCWECHRDVPHGGAHALISAPNNLGVKELK